MAYPTLLFTIGTIFGALAFVFGGWAWVFLWPAASFWLVVLGGYALSHPGILGKRTDGSIPLARHLLFLPFLWFSRAMWWIYRSASREDACNEIAPGIWLGRWPAAADLPKNVEVVIVDVTAELGVRRQVREGRRYICLPTLDGSVPTEAAFSDMLERLRAETGPLFVHCAFGHGRSAMLVGAVLVQRGVVATPEEAASLMKAKRPRVSMSQRQRDYLHRLAAKPR
jgi:protein-tyrosine phosphatase